MFHRSFQLVFGLLLALGLMVPATAMAEQDEESDQESQTEVVEETTEEATESEQSYESDRFQQQDAYYQGGAPSPVGTVLSYALTGGAIGAIIGTGAWLLTGQEWSAWTIAQFAGGGAVIGGGLGLISVLTTETTVAAEDSSAALEFSERDMPKIYDVNLLELRF